MNLMAWTSEDYATMFLDMASKSKFLAVDTEGDGKDVRDRASGAVTMGVSLSYRHPRNGSLMSEYFPFFHKIGRNELKYYDLVKELIETHPCLIFHNVRHDLLALKILGIDPDKIRKFYCTLSMVHFIDENRADFHGNYTLDSVALDYTGHRKNMSEKMRKIIKNLGWENVPVSEMRTYSANDTGITLEVFEKVLPEFQAQGFDGKLWDDEQEFLRTLSKMEVCGVRVDTELCKREIEIGTSRMGEIVEQLGGRRPSSPKDLASLLLDELKIPEYPRRTKEGRSTFDKAAMKYYDGYLSRMGSPVAKFVREFRGWQKTVSTNYSAYLKLLGQDGRLHPNYNTHRAKTSRLSCGTDNDGKTEAKSPNLQNIPKISEHRWDGNLKAAFIPEDGCELWTIDFSNAELKLTACYSGESKLLDTFRAGRNVFDDMSRELRRPRDMVKTFVYATSYNAGDERIANSLGIPLSEASALRHDWLAKYPAVERFKKFAGRKAGRQGFVKYWTGRRRHFINRFGKIDWKEAQHLAFNSIMQGGVAEIVKNRMIAVSREIDWDTCKMLLQVHDELIFEIRKDMVDYWIPILTKIMSDVKLPEGFHEVPWTVEASIWGSKK